MSSSMDASTRTSGTPHAARVDEADAWVERLADGRVETRQKFQEWIRQSPENLREFLILASLDRALGALDAAEIEALEALVGQMPAAAPVAAAADAGETRRSEAPRARAVRTPRVAWLADWPRFAMAAVFAGALVGAVLLILFSGRPPVREYSSLGGAERTVTFTDGSTALMSGGSHLEASFTGTDRRIDLSRGEVLFRVARDPRRPFRVHVTGGTIEAVGTQFDVRRNGDFSWVDVLEGIVELKPDVRDATPTRLLTGERARFFINGRVEPAGEDLTPAADAEPLVFRKTSLASVVKLLGGEVNAHRIVLSAGAERYPFSGILNPDDAPLLITILKERPELKVTERADEVLVELRTEAQAGGTE